MATPNIFNTTSSTTVATSILNNVPDISTFPTSDKLALEPVSSTPSPVGKALRSGTSMQINPKIQELMTPEFPYDSMEDAIGAPPVIPRPEQPSVGHIMKMMGLSMIPIVGQAYAAKDAMNRNEQESDWVMKQAQATKMYEEQRQMVMEAYKDNFKQGIKAIQVAKLVPYFVQQTGGDELTALRWASNMVEARATDDYGTMEPYQITFSNGKPPVIGFLDKFNKIWTMNEANLPEPVDQTSIASVNHLGTVSNAAASEKTMPMPWQQAMARYRVANGIPADIVLTPQQEVEALAASKSDEATLAEQRDKDVVESYTGKPFEQTTAKERDNARKRREIEVTGSKSAAGVVSVLTVDENGNPVTKFTPKTLGAEFTRPETVTAQARNDAKVNAMNAVDFMEKKSGEIITKIGPKQRAEALSRGVDAVFGNDPEFRFYTDATLSLAGNLAVMIQGSRPSDTDILRVYAPLIPTPYRDTKESAKIKWDYIKTLISLPSEGGTPTSGTSGKVAIGSIQVLKNGKKIKVTSVFPDGSFDGDEVK